MKSFKELMKESRGHKILSQKMKDSESLKGFSYPTPEERREQIAKQKEQEKKTSVKESEELDESKYQKRVQGGTGKHKMFYHKDTTVDDHLSAMRYHTDQQNKAKKEGRDSDAAYHGKLYHDHKDQIKSLRHLKDSVEITDLESEELDEVIGYKRPGDKSFKITSKYKNYPERVHTIHSRSKEDAIKFHQTKLGGSIKDIKELDEVFLKDHLSLSDSEHLHTDAAKHKTQAKEHLDKYNEIAKKTPQSADAIKHKALYNWHKSQEHRGVNVGASIKHSDNFDKLRRAYNLMMNKNESVDLDEASQEHEYVMQSLADKDINSHIKDGKVVVHKDNVSKTRTHLKKIGHGDLQVVHEDVEELDEIKANGGLRGFTARHVADYARENGWEHVGGTKHDKWVHPKHPKALLIPRHKGELSRPTVKQLQRRIELKDLHESTLISFAEFISESVEDDLETILEDFDSRLANHIRSLRDSGHRVNITDRSHDGKSAKFISIKDGKEKLHTITVNGHKVQNIGGGEDSEERRSRGRPVGSKSGSRH